MELFQKKTFYKALRESLKCQLFVFVN